MLKVNAFSIQHIDMLTCFFLLVASVAVSAQSKLPATQSPSPTTISASLPSPTLTSNPTLEFNVSLALGAVITVINGYPTWTSSFTDNIDNLDETKWKPIGNSSASSTNGGTIAAGVIGGIVGLALITAVLLWCFRRRRRRSAQTVDENGESKFKAGAKDTLVTPYTELTAPATMYDAKGNLNEPHVTPYLGLTAPADEYDAKGVLISLEPHEQANRGQNQQPQQAEATNLESHEPTEMEESLPRRPRAVDGGSIHDESEEMDPPEYNPAWRRAWTRARPRKR